MVAGCPKCSARYRVDAERIGPGGAKLRCTKCSAVFLVRAPQTAAAPVSADPAPVSEADRARLVLIADPDEARGKASAEAVERWGLLPHVVVDGVEAMLAIQRMLPRAVVLDAALPKMFGFQVCEVVKRNESLRDTVVVLVGAIHHQDRYRRDPSDLYGADVYIEQPDLPEGLKPILKEGGLPIEGEAGRMAEPTASPTEPPRVEPPIVPEAPEDPVAAPPDPEPVVEVPPAPTPEPVVEAPAPQAPQPITDMPATDEDPEVTAERERAMRLARIAVSEMVLYQPEKFEQAAREGNLEQALDLEIQEARALLRQRVSEAVRAETDFIMDELARVAAERTGQG